MMMDKKLRSLFDSQYKKQAEVMDSVLPEWRNSASLELKVQEMAKNLAEFIYQSELIQQTWLKDVSVIEIHDVALRVAECRNLSVVESFHYIRRALMRGCPWEQIKEPFDIAHVVNRGLLVSDKEA